MPPTATTNSSNQDVGRRKASVRDLAVMGGTPAFAEKLFVGRPNIGDRERLLARIDDMLERRWLTNAGRYVQELEQRLADLMGVRHCIAMCNGTVALEIAIRALGLSGEVILPSLTFVATAHALQWQEIAPVFCDIDPATHNIDPARVESLITPRTTGIVGVHLWGRPAEADALAEIAERRGLKLLFDAAHALGCTYKGRMVGGLGDAEVFSFHATKFINAFEGGAVATNDDALAERIRLMKNFGFAGFDNVIYIGTNGKMSEVSAAMGLTSLESMDTFIDTNRANYETYRRCLADIPGVRLLTYDERERGNFQYIVIELDSAQAGIGRDALVEVLHAENVIARRYFYPGCHRMEPYRSYQPHAGLLLGQTEAVAARIVVLPTGTAVDTADIECMCRIIGLAVDGAGAVTERLTSARDDG
jgi:dTDP-4-amino-4,6-dideoxygalactose transaminase